MNKSLKLFSNTIFMAVSAVILLIIVVVASLLTLPDVMQLEKCFTSTMNASHK